MRKAIDLCVLASRGLPVPKFDVFDDECFSNDEQLQRLRSLLADIKESGSGMAGLRTEPKEHRSLIHNYPHFMPLRSIDEVLEAMKCTTLQQPQRSWWFLVNEAFTSYHWNAVVQVTDKLLLPGGLRLDGEVNLVDDMPLRPAMANNAHVCSARSWFGKWPNTLRQMIISSGLTDFWMEISLVNTPVDRLIFWGMRPNLSEEMGSRLLIA